MKKHTLNVMKWMVSLLVGTTDCCLGSRLDAGYSGRPGAASVVCNSLAWQIRLVSLFRDNVASCVKPGRPGALQALIAGFKAFFTNHMCETDIAPFVRRCYNLFNILDNSTSFLQTQLELLCLLVSPCNDAPCQQRLSLDQETLYWQRIITSTLAVRVTRMTPAARINMFFTPLATLSDCKLRETLALARGGVADELYLRCSVVSWVMQQMLPIECATVLRNRLVIQMQQARRYWGGGNPLRLASLSEDIPPAPLVQSLPACPLAHRPIDSSQLQIVVTDSGDFCSADKPPIQTFLGTKELFHFEPNALPPRDRLCMSVPMAIERGLSISSSSELLIHFGQQTEPYALLEPLSVSVLPDVTVPPCRRTMGRDMYVFTAAPSCQGASQQRKAKSDDISLRLTTAAFSRRQRVSMDPRTEERAPPGLGSASSQGRPLKVVNSAAPWPSVLSKTGLDAMCQFGGQVLRRYDLREFDSAGEMDSNKFRQSMLLEPSCCRRDYPDKLNDLLARFFSLLSENDDTFSGVAMGILTYETFRLYHIFKASPVAESKLSPVHRELLHATSFSPNWDGNMLDIVNIIRHWGPIVFDALIAGDDPDPMLAYSFCRIRLALFLLSRGVEPSLFDNDPHLTENPAGVARGLQLMTMYQWQPSQPKTTPCD